MPPPAPAPPPAAPQAPALLNTALGNLAANYPANCELIPLPNRSARPPGVEIRCIRIHTGAAARDPAVLLVGGIHAREWAPPDALVRFAEQLLYANDQHRDISFPALTASYDPPGPPPPVAVSYPAYTIPYTQARDIVRSVDLYIVPCANPDGRLFDITPGPQPFPDGWRKNRRPNPDNGDTRAVGVDLNRNFDIRWDFTRYYDMPKYHGIYTRASDPAATWDTHETFNGVTAPARTVRIVGAPSGGTFRLSFNNRQTAPIAFDAPASTVETRLAVLSTVGAANVAVTGPNGGPYAVTFQAGRGHDVPMITADFSALTGGTNPRVIVDHAPPTCEPEVLNIQWLIDTKRIRFFMDLHQFGRAILIPWGLEDTGTIADENFHNTVWDERRDGLKLADIPMGDHNYNEFMPNDFPYYLRDKMQEIGNSIRDAIWAAAGANPAVADARRDHSEYRVGTSARFYDPTGGGPLTATSDDYAFSRQFVDTSRSPMYSLTVEFGEEEEGLFHPDYSAPLRQYQKIEREIHAAVTAYLTFAARWCHFCVIATAAYGSPDHPDVAFLRRLRDVELRSTPFGRRFVAITERVYYSFSPRVAMFLHRRAWARRPVRALVAWPAILLLRAIAALTAPLRPQGLRIAVLACALAALPPALVVALAALARALLGGGG